MGYTLRADLDPHTVVHLPGVGKIRPGEVVMSIDGKKYPQYLVEVPEAVRPVVEAPQPSRRPLELEQQEDMPLESKEKPTETERKVLMEDDDAPAKVNVRRRR